MLTPLSLNELSSLSFSDLGRIQTEAGALNLPNDKSVAVLRYADVIDAFTNPGLTVRPPVPRQSPPVRTDHHRA